MLVELVVCLRFAEWFPRGILLAFINEVAMLFLFRRSTGRVFDMVLEVCIRVDIDSPEELSFRRVWLQLDFEIDLLLSFLAIELEVGKL